MKRSILFGALVVCASAFSADVNLTPDEKKVCEEGGGCMMITEAAFKRAMTAAYKAGQKEGFAHCKGDA